MSHADDLAKLEYLAKLKVFDAAKSKASALAKTIALIGRAMDNWQDVSVDGTDISFPTSAGFGSRNVNISANTWPTVNQIVEAFAEYHRTHDEVQSAWGRFLPDDRSGLAAPVP